MSGNGTIQHYFSFVPWLYLCFMDRHCQLNVHSDAWESRRSLVSQRIVQGILGQRKSRETEQLSWKQYLYLGASLSEPLKFELKKYILTCTCSTRDPIAWSSLLLQSPNLRCSGIHSPQYRNMFLTENILMNKMIEENVHICSHN